jgi:hypothetical protein
LTSLSFITALLLLVDAPGGPWTTGELSRQAFSKNETGAALCELPGEKKPRTEGAGLVSTPAT